VNLSFSRFAGSFTGFSLDAPAILDVGGTDFWLNDDEAYIPCKNSGDSTIAGASVVEVLGLTRASCLCRARCRKVLRGNFMAFVPLAYAVTSAFA
jgi:hypothetical protein